MFRLLDRQTLSDQNVLWQCPAFQKLRQQQCTYYVILRRVHETTVAVEKCVIFFCVRVCVRVCVRAFVRPSVSVLGCGSTGAGVCLRMCSLMHPACHAQALYCLQPLSLHYIFRHYLINGTIFGTESLNIKCVFWFSLQHLFEIFLVLRRIRRVIVINVKASFCEVHVIFVGF